MSRFVIACGGTGGHLAPGIALAEGLVARGHEPHLLISHKQVDAKLVEKYPWLKLARIPAAPLTANPVGLARFLYQQSAGFGFGLKHLQQLRPAAVVGFGGFTTASIVLAARMRGIPVALHEANRVPGRAVRLLSRFAKRVYLPTGVRLSRARGGTVRAQGLPVRREFQRIARGEALRTLGIQPARRLVAVLGGSQGATALNDWAEKNLELLALEGVQLFCVSGPGKRTAREERVLRSREGAEVKSYFVPFCDRMAELLSCADLAVTRAGAGTLAELARIRTPGVLVPFPHAADDHQSANARYFEQQGGGLVVEQMFLATLTREVQDLVANDWLLHKFHDNLARMDQENSLDAMIDDLLALSDPKNPTSSRLHLQPA
ncbi:MAG TPA: UDP-N-acetylglucosamine--N-acetylmuramyl-(pentapeptide) pyrophosphoryl-undecaprenol N-acetylglucosamine transferase [Opitutaceae bacterium]|nr:UDP-N-acetylglucosamine--N-acetylmuramyl-(pentapeptide) pyrophosphoryl-undecaprenol N-acetylglucosamine transferase [Opitutaceae bacterium]